ncbi:MAG TPA: response regulator [Alphaproteobacteria bacterium]|nr:response regulator [Alphaproteobacteria bacterium]
MHEPPRILVVDDMAENVDILKARLESRGYEVVTASDGEAALAATREARPDLVLLDVMMPKLDGIEVTKRIKADPGLPFIPIILVTAKADAKDVISGLDAGGDDYLTKPVDQASLVARVRSMLRIKALHDKVQDQAAELASWNRTLEERVAAQVGQIERMGKLKRFVPPQVAELLAGAGGDSVMESHRREIVALMCDLRGFTAFSETAEPEDVMALLRSYHEAVGPLIFDCGGTIEGFMGDGILVFFNDPLPCPDPAVRAVNLAVAMRAAVERLAETWRRRGHAIGFGVGIAQGYATLGRVGFEGRQEYSAIGTVMNLAARLCAEAKDGQILLSQRVATAVETVVAASFVGEISLKGLSRPVATYNVTGLAG